MSYRKALTSSLTNESVVKGVEKVLSSSSCDSAEDDEIEDTVTILNPKQHDIRYACVPLNDGNCYQIIVRVMYLVASRDEINTPFEYEVEVAWESHLPLNLDESVVPEEFLPSTAPLMKTLTNDSSSSSSSKRWICNLCLPHHLIYPIPKSHYTADGAVDYTVMFPDGLAAVTGKNHIESYIVTRGNSEESKYVGRVHEIVDYCMSSTGVKQMIVEEFFTFPLNGPTTKVPEPNELPETEYLSVFGHAGKRVRDVTLLDNDYHVLDPKQHVFLEKPSGDFAGGAPFETLPQFAFLFRHRLETLVDSWNLQRVKVERIFTKSRSDFFYGFADDENTYKENAKNGRSCQGNDHAYYFDSNVRCAITTELNDDFLQMHEQTLAKGTWPDKWADTFAPFEEWSAPHAHAILFGRTDEKCGKKHGKYPLRFFAEKEDHMDGFGAFLSYVQTRGKHEVFKRAKDQHVFNMCKARTFHWDKKIGFYSWTKKRTEMTVWASLVRAYLNLSVAVDDPVIIHFMYTYMPSAYAHYKTHFARIAPKKDDECK